MSRQNVSRGSNAVLYTIFALATLVLINVVSAQKFKRYDLTSVGLYTLSDASKKLAGKLEDRLNVKVFLSSDLPPQLSGVAGYFKDLLFEYQANSGGKMHIEVIDPATLEDAKEEAKRLKVMPTRVGQVKGSKQSIQIAYLGASFQYGEKIEAISQIVDNADLEYRISGLMRKLIYKHQSKVAFAQGFGETPAKQLASARKSLENAGYQVVDVDLTKTGIADDIDVLVIVGPKKKYSDAALFAVDQFLMRGKSVAMFLEGVSFQTPRGQFGDQQPPRVAQPLETGLKELLDTYGIKYNNALIFDAQNVALPILVAGGRGYMVSYPGFPRLTNFDKHHAITRMQPRLVFQFPGSVDFDNATLSSSGVTGTALATTSGQSWRHKGLFLFNPARPPKPSKELGPFELAVVARGTFRSHFSGKPVINVSDASQKQRETAEASARLLVVADSDLISDQHLRLSQYAQRSGGGFLRPNLIFFLNSISYLVQDDELIAIQSKTQTRRPLRASEADEQSTMKALNVAGIPLLLALLGIGRWRWRTAARRRYARDYLAAHSAGSANQVDEQAASSDDADDSQDDSTDAEASTEDGADTESDDGDSAEASDTKGSDASADAADDSPDDNDEEKPSSTSESK